MARPSARLRSEALLGRGGRRRAAWSWVVCMAICMTSQIVRSEEAIAEEPRWIPSFEIAFEAGKNIIEAGFSLICGGLSGVMEAACRGAESAAGRDSGRIIGVLPGTSKKDANGWVDIAIPTGVGFSRNFIIACACDGVIAVSGGSGTLSELSMAWQYGKPIVVIRDTEGISAEFAGRSLDTRRNDTVLGAKSAIEAVKILKRRLLEQSDKKTGKK